MSQLFDFGIGVLQGVWTSPENNDIVLQISLHRMTAEDVALLFATFLPVWSLLMYLLCTALPAWWQSLGEKAEADDRVYELAYGGNGKAPAAADEEEGATDRSAGGGGGGPSQGRRFSATRPSRPTDGRSQSATTCKARLLNCLPPQLRPRAVMSRAKSYWQKNNASPLEVAWSLITSAVSSCLCCVCCSAILSKIVPPASKRRLSIGGKQIKLHQAGAPGGAPSAAGKHVTIEYTA